MANETEYVFEDRYSATGRRHNGCDRCDGMGTFPLQESSIRNERERELFEAATPNKTLPSFRFVTCPECKGPEMIDA